MDPRKVRAKALQEHKELKEYTRALKRGEKPAPPNLATLRVDNRTRNAEEESSWSDVRKAMEAVVAAEDGERESSE